MPKFSTDWFDHVIFNFEHCRANLPETKSILEIGCYEGRATCWMLQNMLDDRGEITVIDPFGHTHVNPFNNEQTIDGYSTLEIFKSNTAEVKKPRQKIKIMQGTSYERLAELIVAKKRFDFIYVDGNHCADAALTDACMCFGLLRDGGIMLFDDYLWEEPADHLIRCKASIDAFVNLFRKQLDMMVMNYQWGIRKKSVLINPMLAMRSNAG